MLMYRLKEYKFGILFAILIENKIDLLTLAKTINLDFLVRLCALSKQLRIE